MAIYKLSSNTTLDTAYSGNSISRDGQPSTMLRPYQNAGVWYLREWDTVSSNWFANYFTGGDTLNLNGKVLTLGMSIITPSGTPATITSSAGIPDYILLLPGSYQIDANITAGANSMLRIEAASNGYTITINGNAKAGNAMMNGVSINSSTAAVIINGDVIGGANFASAGCYCHSSSGGSLVINGNAIGGSIASAPGMSGSVGLNLINGNATLNGSATGGNTLSHGVSVFGGSLLVAQDAIGGYGNPSSGVHIGHVNGSVAINGNIRCTTPPGNINMGISGLINFLSWSGYFQMYSGGVDYNLTKEGGSGGQVAAGRSGLYRSLYRN